MGCYLVVLSLRGVAELTTLAQRLHDAGLCRFVFHEPDLNNEPTALSCLVEHSARKHFADLPLWRPSCPTPSPTPRSHTAPTAAELARRARCRELRALIGVEAAKRRMIKAAYRLPHGSPENKAAMAAARVALGLTAHVYDWNAHAVPGRYYWRGHVTELHVELANLRGKVHLTAAKSPA